MKCFPTGLLFLSFCISCTNEPRPVHREQKSYEQGSFGYDREFLQRHDSVLVLTDGSGQAEVIVSPKYQGKVFTSTAEGSAGKSFGWINYKAFDAPLDSHMNAYGGENRLWLGPEGGPFSLFFSKGAAMTFANWKTPPGVDTEAWPVKNSTDSSVWLQKELTLTNYAGTNLQLIVDRKISVMNRKTIEQFLQLPFDGSVKIVGYQTTNTLTNNGDKEWDEKSGVPCIWMLDMFKPSPQTTVVIPFEKRSEKEKVATTDYFGEIPSERIKSTDSVLFFKADGNSRGKLGLNPSRATNVAGSYDAESNVLTIAFFDVDKSGRYLNQQWTTAKPPFLGDAVNAYNDGPLADGKQMGPFFEIESVSPAAFLKPGASLTHNHKVLHFTGNTNILDQLSQKILHASLAEITQALK